MSRTFVLAVVLGVGANTARAGPVTAYFEGVIDFVDPGLGLDGSVAVGTPFWGTYGYEPEGATDAYPEDPNVGSYDFGTSWTLGIHVGNYDFETEDLVVGIWNDVGGQDLYQVSSGSAFTSQGFEWQTMALALQDFTHTVFNSDALPSTVPDLQEFDTAYFGLATGLGDDVSGTLTLLIPEPGWAWALGLGGLILVRRHG